MAYLARHRLLIASFGVVAVAGCARQDAGDIMLGDLGAEQITQVSVEARPEVLSSEAWTFGATPGEVIRTTHYRIFTTESNKGARRRLASFSEHALAHYRTALGPLPSPPVRLDTYLMDNRPQWERLTKQLMGTQANQLLAIQRGGYASRGIGVYYDLGLFDTCAIAAHEGWHQYTQRTFRDPLPIWLEEGIATYMEGHSWSGTTPIFRAWSNVERFDQLRRAANKNTLLKLDVLLNSRPQDYVSQVNDSLLTYYAQLWALSHFLNEGEQGIHSGPLRQLISDAAEGNCRKVLTNKLGSRRANLAFATRSGDAFVEAYFNTDLTAMSQAYDRFLQSIVRPGARDAIVAGRSPIVQGVVSATP